MDRFRIDCTYEQVNKAITLGAPIILYTEEYDNSVKKDNEFYIANDIVFDCNEDVCYNENGDLVCIIGVSPNRKAYYVPTGEEMIGWLEAQKEIRFFAISNFGYDVHTYNELLGKRNLASRKEATIEAIDATLEYLTDIKSFQTYGKL